MNRTQSQSTLPLRSEADRQELCDRYFTSVGATLVYQSDGYREFELPRDVDKELTDRPFYWMWVEKTGQSVPPTVLRLAYSMAAADRENIRLREEAFRRAEEKQLSDMEKRFLRPPTAEYITLGCFRLNKIYESLDRRGKFASIRVGKTNHGRLIPWVALQVLVSLRCDLVEQMYKSYALCLTNGQIVEGFYEKIARLEAHAIKPAELLQRATIPMRQALNQLTEHIEIDIRKQPTDWADIANERLRLDIQQLNTYYDSLKPTVKSDEEAMLLEKERTQKTNEAIQKSTPRVELDVKQAALVGLPERT